MQLAFKMGRCSTHSQCSFLIRGVMLQCRACLYKSLAAWFCTSWSLRFKPWGRPREGICVVDPCDNQCNNVLRESLKGKKFTNLSNFSELWEQDEITASEVSWTNSYQSELRGSWLITWIERGSPLWQARMWSSTNHVGYWWWQSQSEMSSTWLYL